jgi:hypothetical protein
MTPSFSGFKNKNKQETSLKQVEVAKESEETMGDHVNDGENR